MKDLSAFELVERLCSKESQREPDAAKTHELNHGERFAKDKDREQQRQRRARYWNRPAMTSGNRMTAAASTSVVLRLSHRLQ